MISFRVDQKYWIVKSNDSNLFNLPWFRTRVYKMEPLKRSFKDLFEQLGLDSTEQAISYFISDHMLASGEALDKAPFWTPTQAEFIKESWLGDSDWAEVIELLNVSLHQSH